MDDATRNRITFTGADGTSQLAARLDRPQGPPIACALFAHCFTCGKDIFAASRIAAGLTRHGIAVLRFDFTGLGASEGEFANTNFSSNLGDLVAAADWMRETIEAPKILIGHSLGGAAVLAAAERIPEAVAVATIAAPADPGHVQHLFSGSLEVIQSTGEAEVRLAGRPFRIRKTFLDDIASHRLETAIGGLGRALLVFHAPNDKIVSIDNASRIFIAAKHPKSFVSLDDADHLLARREDAIYVANVIAAWAGRYVGAVEPIPETTAQMSPKAGAAAKSGGPLPVTVAETGQGRFQQMIIVGDHHRLFADEPAAFGGTDTGPSPYDLLVAGLGACTTMTIRMYAEHKSLPLERVAVTLTHQKIHASDCADCETRDGKVDHIHREITLQGDLDEATRARLLEIADRCPVHRTLHSEVWIETSLKQ
ncbi:MAG: alpha/beta fold hydrolase [Rhodospirillales bacterium]|nr:MAG: alpha/beta fold hydrolase [Rhodospirillales bacterium]